MSGETQVEVQIHHHSHGDPMGKLSRGGVTGGGGSSGMHSSGGSTGEDSSGEEPPHHVLPKKIRLKECPNIKPSSSLISMICSSGISSSRENLIDDGMHDQDQDQDDECSNGASIKEGRMTSGENSDAEGDEHFGPHSKLQDSSKKMFECDVCNMRFSNGANMRRHRMRHSGIKPFECKICQKRFFRKDHLAEHMATHSKLLPFRCPICNKGFQRQIAMRAHFQNEHVGGSQDVVKACPLCAYKAGSMKSLRVHFYSRHGIDLDNPMPHSPSLLCPSGGRGSGSPGPNGGEYSELAHALGFEDREKSSDSIPSHFLVPQIEISSNSPYPPHFPFNPDSSYPFPHEEKHYYGKMDENGGPNISPQSDSSSSHLPSSSDLIKVVVKKEHLDESEQSSLKGALESKSLQEMDIMQEDDVQDMPEDLSSSGTANSYRSTDSPPKCSSSSLLKTSPLKSLLREEWRGQDTQQTNGSGGKPVSSRGRSDSSSGHSSNSTTGTFQTQSCDGEAITSSNGAESGVALYGKRGVPFPALHQCVYCGIIFPNQTLYFLHKGCHSESNPWRCNICGELATNVYDFNSHLLSKSHQ